MTGLFDDITVVFRGANSYQSDSNKLDFKNFPGGACPRTPLDECASNVPSTTGFARSPCFVLTGGRRVEGSLSYRSYSIFLAF